jgi:nitroimidazol reductase NimA-like FMN-containing flavoprotein (pyridoxamine 5'-phosphate oxidase superfamily)
MARNRPQRSSQPMSDAEIETYLDAGDEWAMLTTIGKDGFPHTVAIGYFRVGDDLYLGMRDDTQKIKNVVRNPKASVLVTASKTKGDVTGVMIQGDASIVRDDAERLELAREAARQRGLADAELPQEASPGGVFMKLTRHKAITWSFS